MYITGLNGAINCTLYEQVVVKSVIADTKEESLPISSFTPKISTVYFDSITPVC